MNIESVNRILFVVTPHKQRDEIKEDNFRWTDRC